jgi:hypothetical protein
VNVAAPPEAAAGIDLEPARVDEHFRRQGPETAALRIEQAACLIQRHFRLGEPDLGPTGGTQASQGPGQVAVAINLDVDAAGQPPGGEHRSDRRAIGVVVIAQVLVQAGTLDEHDGEVSSLRSVAFQLADRRRQGRLAGAPVVSPATGVTHAIEPVRPSASRLAGARGALICGYAKTRP